MKLSEIKTVYFLGIGGIGMSALARYFKSMGAEVHGYDRGKNDFTTQLESEGLKIHYDADTDAIPDAVKKQENALVIYTPAIPQDHKEYRYFLNRKIPMYKRSQILGMISEGCYTIAVAGTHGKTSTS